MGYMKGEKISYASQKVLIYSNLVIEVSMDSTATHFVTPPLSSTKRVVRTLRGPYQNTFNCSTD